MVKLEGLLARQTTRRKVVGLLSAGAGVFSIAKVGAGLQKMPFPAGTASAARVTFPKRAIIRAVLQDMSPALLASGPVLFHEHLSLRLAGLEELVAAEIAFGCLNGNVTEQKLDWLQFASGRVTEPSAGPEEVMGR